MPKYTEEDLVYIHLLRAEMGNPWVEAKPRIIARLPEGYAADLLDKFVDDRPDPGIHTNAYGVEPRFYPHRTSGRLLEFYRSKE